LLANVAEEYVSFNFDTSQLGRLNLSSPVRQSLAKALAPAHLRVGGTQADYNIYTFGEYVGMDCGSLPHPMTSYRCKLVDPVMWGQLLDFSENANLTLVFGLNDLFGRPTKTKPEKRFCGKGDAAAQCPAVNLSNAAALLRWTVENRPAAVYGFELGK
jgi:hypothetical protein